MHGNQLRYSISLYIYIHQFINLFVYLFTSKGSSVVCGRGAVGVCSRGLWWATCTTTSSGISSLSLCLLYLSIYAPVCLSIYLIIDMSIYLSILKGSSVVCGRGVMGQILRLTRGRQHAPQPAKVDHLSIYQSSYLSIYLSIYLVTYLSIYIEGLTRGMRAWRCWSWFEGFAADNVHHNKLRYILSSSLFTLSFYVCTCLSLYLSNNRSVYLSIYIEGLKRRLQVWRRWSWFEGFAADNVHRNQLRCITSSSIYLSLSI